MPSKNSSFPPDIDTSTPSPARLYDYYLGGKDNFASDRQAAQRLYAKIPELRSMALANRMWLRRVVKHMAQAGIHQFIDIGSGLPTQDPVHQVAHRHAPGCRAVYVDNDPIVLVHARALLADDPATTTVVEGDLRDPRAILTHPETRRLIDFTQPVGLLLIAVLHFLRDADHPYGVVRQLRDALCPGSQLAISHVDNTTAPERAAFLESVYAASSAPGQTRSHHDIAAFFNGLEPVDPGLAYVSDWRPESGDTYFPPEKAWVYGGIGRILRPAATDAHE
ncbi:trans-aconitate methyltransferase [Spinactinospora alkalitolerans]|uniref:Trans-aconitate methyltransferase n=1 Tax=Spinactinospora alkalitolerans TaxID=687207 RepID=A0A852TZQ3_9ACTN|nr:SAM-dependent methyltransferase [Spinactinospora alkalitolerans]NYE50056.1 trans-aconitate methyltransferase [Spinactinospora alkalitolerans]